MRMKEMDGPGRSEVGIHAFVPGAADQSSPFQQLDFLGFNHCNTAKGWSLCTII
jgi:hypothetical protein